MQLLKRITDWWLYTSMFATLCAVSLCIATERLILGYTPLSVNKLHLFIAGCTMMVYNAHFLLRKSLPSVSDRYNWTVRNKHWHFIVFGTGLLLSGYCFFLMPYKVVLACMALGLLSFAYTLPLLPFKTRLRDFGWLKIITLTLVWTIVTSVLPIVYWDRSLLAYPFEMLMRLVFMFILCVAFDIRDMETDKDQQIYTIPNLIGRANSNRLINWGLLLFVVLCIIQYWRYPNIGRLAAEMIIALITKWMIQYCEKYPSDKHYLGLVDGMMLIYGVVIVVLS